MEEVKKSKKKNKVASLLLALALILTCGVAGTIAQYTKSLGGTSTANIAKFEVKAGSLDSQYSDIELFEAVKDTKTGEDETDVKKEMIAPGTQGSYRVDLTNTSQVNVHYQLSANWAENSGKHSVQVDGVDTELPLKFKLVSITGTEQASIDQEVKQAMDSEDNWLTIGELNQDGNKAKIPSGDLEMEKGKKTVYLCWKWAFGTSDEETDATNKLDTAVGEAMADSNESNHLNPIVKIGVKFTQID